MTPAPPPSSPAPNHDDDGGGGGGGGNAVNGSTSAGLKGGSGLSRRQRKNCKKREKAERVPVLPTSAPSSKKGSKATTAACATYEKLGMSDQQIYYWIYSYCLDLIRLRRIGFPLESELHPGASVVYVDPDLAPLNSELCYEDDMMVMDDGGGGGGKVSSSQSLLDVNAQEFVPSAAAAAAQTKQIETAANSDTENTDSSSPTPPDATTTTAGDAAAAAAEENESKDAAANAAPANNNINNNHVVASGGSTTSLNVSAKEFVPLGRGHATSNGLVGSGQDEDSSGSSNDEELATASSEARQCARCSKTFYVDGRGQYLSREKCLYHWGKVHYGDCDSDLSMDIFTCCHTRVMDTGGGGGGGGGLLSSGGGCCTAKVHVWRGRLFQMPGLHGPFKNFIRTKGRKCNPPNGYHGVYALDGEMCYTTQGMELIRVSVVGIDGRPVYDTLVQPENPIVDYNTRFSGLTDRDMKNNPVKSLRHVQNDLMGFISSSTILIGHGLENDFRALRLVHTLVVDTSVLYPHYYGLPYRRSLKSLARSYLKQDIQTAAHGHDSFEDARASLELVLCKVKAEVASTVKNSNGNSNANKGLLSQSPIVKSKLQQQSVATAGSTAAVTTAACDGNSSSSSSGGGSPATVSSRRKQQQQHKQPPSPVIPTSSIYSSNSPLPCELSANSKSRLKYEERFVEESSCWFDME